MGLRSTLQEQSVTTATHTHSQINRFEDDAHPNAIVPNLTFGTNHVRGHSSADIRASQGTVGRELRVQQTYARLPSLRSMAVAHNLWCGCLVLSWELQLCRYIGI
jgi:hypothetical protein